MSVGSTARRQLRSASTSDFMVPPTRRASIGDRAFAVAGPRAWNSLPPALRSTSKWFSSFKKNLDVFWTLTLLVTTKVSKYEYFYTARLKKVHNGPWSNCPNTNVFSDRLNQECHIFAFRKSADKLFHTLVAAADCV